MDPAWEDRLLGLLDKPMPDRKDEARFKDESYRQKISADLLGILRSEKAIEPLLRVMLSSAKQILNNLA